ncbi:hypothetical protein [Proteiniphilum propionicum]|uniref:hypothetical protein n=1 Tax=Proteiniphilum propionicum TaxID=2829812 RepID=UPI001EE9CE6D|nr:hypothetical protein [Proteiniphilum propionicum]ULB34778.1 hypothetical protein KDN43_01580 [Proteiniphilum propionicum]
MDVSWVVPPVSWVVFWVVSVPNPSPKYFIETFSITLKAGYNLNKIMARLADTPPKKKLGGIHRVRDEYPAGNGGYFLSNFQIAVFV